MDKRKDWTRLGTIVGVTGLLVVAFVVSVNSARPGGAQEVARTRLLLNDDNRSSGPVTQTNAVELGESFTAASEAVRHSVVYIRAVGVALNGQTQSGSGSGFVITTDGYIITNNHVVENAERITVSLLDQREFEAQLIGKDANTDIAVLKISATDLHAVVLANSDDVSIGEWVLAIGNPLGFTFSVTAGIVSAKGRLLAGLTNSSYAIQDFIQTDAAINPGNSGGPLVNIRGEVVGVNSALASQTGLYTGYGFAIPINLGFQIAEMLITEGGITRSLLGVSIRDATPEDAEFVGLDSIFGVTIQSFTGLGSPAERAGLQLGDVIVDLDGEQVGYTAQLQQTVGFKRPGQIVQVTIQREGGVRRTFPVELIAQNLTPVARVSDRPQTPRLRDPSRTGLGIGVEPMAAGDVEVYGQDGPIVRVVDPTGPSAGGRLERGYAITHAQSRRVRTPEELREALAGVEAGTIVDLRYVAIVGRNSEGRLVSQTGVARIKLGQRNPPKQ